MKALSRLLPWLPLASAILFATTGCNTPVAVTAGYGVPGTNITATVNLGTNAVTVGGNYQAGATNIGGTITVGK